MNSFEIQLKALVKCFSEQRIKYAVLGGIAVLIYGEPRLTADIDVNIILNRDEIGKFLEKAKRYGFWPRFTDVQGIARKTGVIPIIFRKGPINGLFDIIIAENILEYSAIKRARVKKIGSVKVRLVSPEDLIIHKITSSRPRDIEDLSGILIRQRGRLDITYIRNWLKKIDSVSKNGKFYKTFKELMVVA